VKCIEDIKSESAARPIDRSWHQASSKKLDMAIGMASALAEGDRKGVNAAGIHNGKVIDWSAFAEARTGFMTQAQREAKFPQT